MSLKNVKFYEWLVLEVKDKFIARKISDKVLELYEKCRKNRSAKDDITLKFLFSKADCSGGKNSCWNWLHAHNSPGYGRVRWNNFSWQAHRLVKQLELNRKLLKKEFVLHACDNPKCINPNHLIIGSQSDNIKHQVIRKRHKESSKTHCPLGHEYNKENTSLLKTNSGFNRQCRACSRIRYYRYKYSKKYLTRKRNQKKITQ